MKGCFTYMKHPFSNVGCKLISIHSTFFLISKVEEEEEEIEEIEDSMSASTTNPIKFTVSP